MSRKILDVPVLVLFDRYSIKNSILLPKNHKNFTTLEEVIDNTEYVKSISNKAINKYKQKLKRYGICNDLIEAMEKRKSHSLFSHKPKFICIFKYKDSIQNIDDFMEYLRNKYKGSKIIVFGLENRVIPHKGATSPRDIRELSYIEVNLLLEILRLTNPAKYKEYSEKLDYYSNHSRFCGELYIAPDYRILLRNQNKKDIIYQLSDIVASKFVSYGCGLGDYKLIGYLPRSLKNLKNRDKKLNSSNKQFYNVDKFNVRLGLRFAFTQSRGSIWNIMLE